MSEVVRETMLLCWHLVSGYLAQMALFLFLGARGQPGLALAGLMMATATVAIGVSFPLLRGKTYRLLPQG